MALKTTKPGPLAKVTGLGLDKLPSTSFRDNSAAPSHLQEKWIAARFGLAAHHAKLVAALAFGEVRT